MAPMMSMQYYEYKDPAYPKQTTHMTLVTTSLGERQCGFSYKKFCKCTTRFSGLHGKWDTGPSVMKLVWHNQGERTQRRVTQIFIPVNDVTWRTEHGEITMAWKGAMILGSSNKAIKDGGLEEALPWTQWLGGVTLLGYTADGCLDMITRFHVWSNSTADDAKKVYRAYLLRNRPDEVVDINLLKASVRGFDGSDKEIHFTTALTSAHSVILIKTRPREAEVAWLVV